MGSSTDFGHSSYSSARVTKGGYVKQAEHQRLFTEYDGREAKVSLTTIALELALADLYENAEF